MILCLRTSSLILNIEKKRRKGDKKHARGRHTSVVRRRRYEFARSFVDGCDEQAHDHGEQEWVSLGERRSNFQVELLQRTLSTHRLAEKARSPTRASTTSDGEFALFR